MKKILSAVVLSLALYVCQAQTKVFKEVGEDISSQVRVIRQDNALVGYLVFTQLEKASADSFNYKITIMDENLNDIGTVNFKEQKLYLENVSFEQDVLCLAYQKSNFIGYDFKNKKEYKAALPNAQTSVFVQFLSLDGKIIKSNTIKADVKHVASPELYTYGQGSLKYSVLLKNIPGQGFACFYGDESKKRLLVYNSAGNLLWQKNVKSDDAANIFWLLTTPQQIYIMTKKPLTNEGGYQLLGYGISDSTAFPSYDLKDKQGNDLKVLSFDYDPTTRKPFLSGYIIDPEKGVDYYKLKYLAKGTYSGVFTINVNGPKKGDINEVFSYWADGSQSFITPKSRLQENRTYLRCTSSFKDFEGNTWYAGSSFVKKTRVGGIIVSVVLAPLLYPTFMNAAAGYTKVRTEAPIFLKQTAKGAISLNNTVAADSKRFTLGKITPSTDPRSFYFQTSPETKTVYTIIDDEKNIYIYNVTQKKVTRTIPHKDGNMLTYIYPAKEGHITVSEYNKKERYTRVSIEAL